MSTFQFLSTLPAVLGIAGFVTHLLLRSRTKGDDVSRRVIEKLRAVVPGQSPPSGLRSGQLLAWLEMNNDLQHRVSEQDYALLRQALRHRHRESVLVYLLVSVLFLVSLGLYVYGQLRPRALELDGFRLESVVPKAKGLAVDTDTLRVSWEAEGRPEDIDVVLQNVQTMRSTGAAHVSSQQHQVLFAPEQYTSVLSERAHGGFNRVRVVARGPGRTWTSNEFRLEVGVTVVAFFDHESNKLCVTALIDNESIPFYAFEAKALIWTVGPKPELLGFGDKMSTPKTCFLVKHPERLRWSDLELAYFGPDDDRIVRTTTLVDEEAVSARAHSARVAEAHEIRQQSGTDTSSRSPDVQEWSGNVAAEADGWVETGVSVQPGDLVRFTAWGRLRFGSLLTTDANGGRPKFAAEDTYRSASSFDGTFRLFQLVARVVDSKGESHSDVLSVGLQSERTMTHAGHIELAIARPDPELWRRDLTAIMPTHETFRPYTSQVGQHWKLVTRVPEEPGQELLRGEGGYTVRMSRSTAR